jgi:fluoroacetyl-CoA thioesterase
VDLEAGLTGKAECEVTEADTAIALRSGSVPVLGTPRVIALCEEATVAAVAALLEPGQTTVGMKVQIDHLKPSPIGAHVTAEAWLEKNGGRRLTFTVKAHDDRDLIAVGRITRAIVDTQRFLDSVG